MTMDALKPLRCLDINNAVLSDDKSAVLLELVMENGQLFPLELEQDGIDLMARGLLMSAHAMGVGQEGRPELGLIAPSSAIQVEAHEVIVRAQADGPVMMLRVGSLDLTVKLPNQVLASALANALHGPKS
jgi:hypothetical protein